MKMQKKASTEWSPNLSYIIGIIATDGNLSKDQRHIVITSKDKILLTDIRKSLSLSVKIGNKARGGDTEKKYFVLQIGDRNFYIFLESIGLTTNKSKTIGKLVIPKEYFSHFLRGCIDGDGNIDVFIHKESSHKQLRVRLASASTIFLDWIIEELKEELSISGGWIYSPKNKSCHVLTYGKADSIKILRYIYSDKNIFLERKFKIAKEFF